MNRLLVNRMLVAWDNSISDQRDIPRRESAMAAVLEVALAWERARIEEEIRLSWGSPEQMFADVGLAEHDQAHAKPTKKPPC